MFKRFGVLIIAMFVLSFAALAIFWQHLPGRELYSTVPLTTADRIIQDLGGKWNSYSSLREAWDQETRLSQTGEKQGLKGLIQVKSLVLPSDQGFQVATKRFRVTGKWGGRPAQLVLGGLYGQARVFLNGIDEVNFLGEIEGAGGIYTLDISPARLNLSEENIFYLEMAPTRAAQAKLFGRLWPELGRVTGQIRLEAVAQSSIELSRTTVSYDPGQKQLTVGVSLKNHQLSGPEVWTLSGVLKDQGEKVADCLLPFTCDGQRQKVDLVFNLPETKFWSLDNPVLYVLELTLNNNRGVYDRVQLPIGVRKPDYNFAINGQILTQKQEFNIRNKRQVTEYLNNLKDQGINVLYFMGFFPDEEWLYTADRLGLGVWLELPVSLATQGKLPSPQIYEELILLAEHHPSVLAWTAAKGAQPSAETNEYLRQVKQRIGLLPVYNLILPGQEKGSNPEVVVLGEDGLQGEWGQVLYQSSSQAGVDTFPQATLFWAGEKKAAILWLVFLLLITVQNFRSPNWAYEELYNPNPKRKIRRAFFWRSLGFVSRMFTLGAIFVSFLFRLPLEIPYWLSYDISPLLLLRSQSPLLLWLFCSSLFSLIRMMQVGLAAASWPEHPSTLGLCCWLERRYSWVFLVGIAWVGVCYGWPWFTPWAVYCLFLLLLLPWRVKDVWKTGGKYRYFLLLPFTALVVGAGISLWQRDDLLYLLELVWPKIQAFQLFNINF
ncbi:MAG TPA: beta-galactosidase [Peptococcaceae bacterium]|nr:beta-galactosidase [Peptococcaceae bacterium]